MFSKLLHYARDILNLQTSAPQRDLEEENTLLTTAMVTTRRQSRSNSDPATEISVSLERPPPDIHSTGSRKRRRPEVVDGSISRMTQNELAPTITRKRQRLPVREKDEPHFERHTHIAVEIPVRDITQNDAPMWTAPEKIKPKRKLVVTEDILPDSHVNGLDSGNDEEAENDILRPIDQREIEEATLSQENQGKTIAKQEGSKNGGFKSRRKKNSSPMPAKAANISNVIKPKHKRFGSEEPAAEELGMVVEEVPRVEEQEESSDDDDAPEVVATHDAEKKARVTARTAAKAVVDQEAAIRKKRKDRDAQLKEQAKAASKKRKHADTVNEDYASSIPLDTTASLDANENQNDPSRSPPDAMKDNIDSAKFRTIINKNNIPEFLPAEYLEDGPIEDEISFSSTKQIMAHKSKKIKFTDPTPKKPKDRGKGSTVYRIAEGPGDGLLAPKAAINARFVKEAWLNGQRGNGGSMKIVKGGFFKSRK